MMTMKERRKNRRGVDVPLADIEMVREAISYDPETGDFLWRKTQGRQKEGARAGTSGVAGYKQVTFNNMSYLAHRLAWAMHYGKWPVGQIDHINHDRGDNRITNLRVVDNLENHRNLPLRANNRTGHAGVTFCKFTGRYMASITIGGRKIFLGRFDTIPEAAEARREANVKYGFHENHGHGPSISKSVQEAGRKKEGKPFAVVSPSGEQVFGVNLSKFCKKNGLLQSCLHDVVKGKAKSHKGWTAAKPVRESLT
jgi:hypothetical protein